MPSVRTLPPGRDLIVLLLGLVTAATLSAEDSAPACFDVDVGFDAPLHQPTELGDAVEGSAHGRRSDGVDWAATRALVELPAWQVLEKLRDHRNVKDMQRTTLNVQRRQRPGYLEVSYVDVDVTVRALLLKLHIRWTEEWAYRLLAGSAERPELVLINYQKVSGTKHIRHQCGSYVIRALGERRTDLFMYEEVRARRRSAEDTRAMHQGILRNIREDVWPTPGRPELPARDAPASKR